MEEDSRGMDLGNVIRIDDERVRDHLGRNCRHALVDQTISEHGPAQAAQRDVRLTGARHRPKVRKILDTTLHNLPDTPQRRAFIGGHSLPKVPSDGVG